MWSTMISCRNVGVIKGRPLQFRQRRTPAKWSIFKPLKRTVGNWRKITTFIFIKFWITFEIFWTYILRLIFANIFTTGGVWSIFCCSAPPGSPRDLFYLVASTHLRNISQIASFTQGSRMFATTTYLVINSWPFYPLTWRSPTTFERDHVFTIPKRLPGVVLQNSPSKKRDVSIGNTWKSIFQPSSFTGYVSFQGVILPSYVVIIIKIIIRLRF